MDLIAVEDLTPEELGRVIQGGESEAGPRRLIAVLDFLPLGVEGLLLRRAAARCGADLVFGGELFPGFPASTDLLAAAETAGAYADALVVRHPWRGSALAAAEVSGAPVLSAGDGVGEDPLFAVADLAALSSRLSGLSGRSVALCGDLLRNRRAHSLAGGLPALGARVLLVPAKGAEPESGLIDGLARRHGSHPVRFEARSMSSLLSMVDSWLLTPDIDHQYSLFTDLVATSDRERRAVRHQVRDVDAILMAAPRDEEGEPRQDGVTEPLPWRREDIREFVSPLRPEETAMAPALRAAAEIRAVAALLELAFTKKAAPAGDAPYRAPEGIRCRNTLCVACREPVRVVPAFSVLRSDPIVLACLYCGEQRKAAFVGSRVERKYHAPTSSQVPKILPRNRVYFSDLAEAAAAGFAPSKIG